MPWFGGRLPARTCRTPFGHAGMPVLSMPRLLAASLLISCLPGALPTAAGADLGTIDGYDVRVDVTLRGTFGLRLAPADPALLADVNADDGDRAFGPGPESERVDMATQVDVTRGAFGVELGTDGWYDQLYHQSDANRSPATFNAVSVPSDRFPSDTSSLLGGLIELQDAYVHDKLTVAGAPVTIRIGRQTLIWGESLFFPQDGIAGGQAPVDEIKELSQPLVESQEVYLPVTQADVRVQLPHGLSIEAYEQVEWRRDRTPGVASYFSTSDVLDTGGERILEPDGTALQRGRDIEPPGTGQFGAALRYASGELDLGLYGLRFNAKDPQVVAFGDEPGTYRAVFPRGIVLIGASASTYVDDDTLAGEISERWHMPLVGVDVPALPMGAGALPLDSAGDTVSAPPEGYATGRTLEGLLSFDSQLRPGRFWNAATVDAEIVATDLLGTETNPSLRLAGTTRLSSAAEIVFAPQYFQVWRNVDITVPVGVQLGLTGHSSVDPGQVAGTGALTLSVTAAYRTVWQAGVSLTHFIGSAHEQALADRDFLVFTLTRTL